ncbi:MAG: peptidoglycan DD-metalloendopeptidase family protein [Candidatus Delongbacteria bacterium]|jgi:murein DD-endopeptidase MepM/ murein hydrolase activator NlpD|nr:peptidoglycan DD-metalloendopeptidase family protein [Candidatus Delongbacteria bacterium]
MKKYRWIFIVSAFLILAGILTVLILRYSKRQKTLPEIVKMAENPDEPVTKYGIPVDSFTIVYDTVKRGHTLSDLLTPYHVNLATIDKIGKMSTHSFRIDRINAGQPYAVFCKEDSASELVISYLVYENNGIDYTVYDFSDSVYIIKDKKPVEFVEHSVCGTINSSLWMALKNQNADPLLALEMADIYSWSIDFFGLKKGDTFKMIYETARVEGCDLFIEGIIAGYMKHAGEDFWAIPFERNGQMDFYELDGASLRKTFLKSPLRYNRISSRFTNSRMHPVLKYRRPHRAIDYSAPTGTPIRTIGDGVITLRKYGSGAGYYIKVKHNSVYTSVYMHMSRYGKYQVGQRVKQGDIIGYVGSTGLSTGPHLHFEVHKHGHQINPLTLESPPADPVPDNLIDEFNTVKVKWIERIEAIPCDTTTVS